jgi:hypothetical protein
MDRSKHRIVSQSGLGALALAVAGTLALLQACSSDGGNAAPSTPVITTGGTSGSTAAAGKDGAGDSAGGSSAGTSAHGGSGQAGGASAHAGSGDTAGEAGEGGAAGAAGAESGAGRGGGAPACPTSDLGFLNQPSKSQTSGFDNVERLGTHDTLPPLP